MRITSEDAERFWSKVDRPAPDGCWTWMAYKTYRGYGQLWYNGKYVYAHRLSWEIHNAPIPKGLCVCHTCDVRDCVNPTHLFLGTHADNAADRDAKGRYRPQPGESNGQAKLTTAQVLVIRSRQGQTGRSLAKEFNVSPMLISDIRRGERWRHL